MDSCMCSSQGEPSTIVNYKKPKRDKKGQSPRALRETMALQTTGFWTSSPQNCESKYLLLSATHFVVILLMQSWGTNTGTNKIIDII